MSALPTSQPWAQSLRGRAIDLLHPRAEQVDFREIADVLAQATRYAGNAERAVSIGHHTLIALKAARQRRATTTLQAMVVLHDAHEWILGDWTTPACEALDSVVEEMAPPTGVRLSEALAVLKRRHDTVIHAAAGVPLPSAEQRAFIHDCDIVALLTEKRDFLAPCERAWGAALSGVAPLPRREPWLPPAQVAAELARAFRMLLPFYREGRRAVA